jgi:hypothetical protein
MTSDCILAGQVRHVISFEGCWGIRGYAFATIRGAALGVQMMAHKGSVSRRLSDAFKLLPKLGDSRVSIVPIGRGGKPTGEKVQILEWKDVDDDTKGRAFGMIPTLPITSPLAAAFGAAELDPNDPIHWYQLLTFFAWAHFGDRRKRGAPTKWDSARYCTLINDFNAMKLRNQALSDEDVFKHLGRGSGYRTRKRPLSPSRLRKLLKEARDPKRNELLGAFERGGNVNNFQGM